MFCFKIQTKKWIAIEQLNGVHYQILNVDFEVKMLQGIKLKISQMYVNKRNIFDRDYEQSDE